MQRNAMQASAAVAAAAGGGGKVVEDAASAELHKQVRHKVEDVSRLSETFLRRIEGCLEEPYEYGAARQDYEGILTRVTDVKALLAKRGIIGMDGLNAMSAKSKADPMGLNIAMTTADVLARAKKEQQDIDRQYDRIAAAAAAAARTR